MTVLPSLGKLTGIELTDALPKEWRLFVHEYNIPIAKAFLVSGITNPDTAHHLITTVRGDDV